ncbi:MAG: DUF2155 domain-containing protein [Aestuariivirgaceae bacterium]
MKRLAASLVLLAVALGTSASAERLKNPVAFFAGLDKITGTITTFEVAIDETKQFGSLVVRPRVCYSRPPEEEPKTTSFVEVEELGLNREKRRIFTGWMFAESPGLNAVEHPVYDVWLTACIDPNAPKPVVEEDLTPSATEQQEVPQDNE